MTNDNFFSSLYFLTVPIYALYFSINSIILVFFFLHSFPIYFLFSLFAFTLAIFALNSFNQVTDKHIDILSKKYRPIINFTISENYVYFFVYFFYLLSAFFGFLSNNFFIQILLLFFIVLSFFYSLNILNLRKFFGSNIFGTIFYGIMPVLLSWNFSSFFLTPFLLQAIINTFFIASLKDYEDLSADKKYGIVTLPNFFGKNKSKKIILIGLFLSIIFSSFYSIYLFSNFFKTIIFLFFCLTSLLLFNIFFSQNIKSGVLFGFIHNIICLTSLLIFF